MKMNKKSIITGLFVAMFLVVGTIGPAVAEEPITGMIAEEGDYIILDTEDGTYILEGDVTSEMVGKKVMVTGTIAEKDDMQVISVTSFEEVAE